MEIGQTEEVSVIIQEKRRRGMLDNLVMSKGIALKLIDMPDGKTKVIDIQRIMTRERLSSILWEEGFTPVEIDS